MFDDVNSKSNNKLAVFYDIRSTCAVFSKKKKKFYEMNGITVIV